MILSMAPSSKKEPSMINSRIGILLLISILLLTLSLTTRANLEYVDIFSEPHISQVELRPDGKAVVLLKEQEKKQSLILKILSDGKETLLFTPSEYGGEKSVASQIVWLNNQYLAIQFIEPKPGIADLLNTKISRRLLIIDTYAVPGRTEQVLSVRTSGWLANVLPTSDGEFLYAKSGMQSRIYKLQAKALNLDKATLSKADKIDGGQFIASNQLIEVEGYATKWFINPTGGFKAVLHYAEPYVLSLTEFGSDNKQEKVFSWKLLEEKSKDDKNNKGKTKKIETVTQSIDQFLPLAAAKDASEYYCLDMKENDSKSLYLVNFKNKTFKLIYETAAFKIVDLVFSPSNELIGVQVLKDQRLAFEAFSQDSNGVNISNKLVINLGTSLTAKEKLVYEESFNQPGQFWLETAGKQRQLIGEQFPGLVKKLHSKQFEGTTEIEGLKIPYLLNIPDNQTSSPLIVMPHGGPIGVFDSPYFDQFTQYLNAQGYAVLRINFRGSSGISKEFKDAGKKQWGGLILKDIHQTALEIMKRREIDKNRVCIFGLSYGAYAASALLIQHPETYKCAIAVAGVYDLNLHLQSAQISDEQASWLKEYVGDYVTEYDTNKSISPVYMANQLKNPLLLIHGNQDEVVDIEQSARMKLSLDKAQKKVDFIILDKEGHSVGSAEGAKKLFDPVIKFIKSNI
jgi:pimeloyl-ACP methyl ester carboxylesterase